MGTAVAASTLTPTMTSFAATTAATAATTAYVSYVPTLLTASQGISVGGGLMGTIGSIANTIAPYAGVISSLSSGAQAYNAYNTGQTLQSSYDLQATQVLAQAEVDRLNRIEDSRDRLQRLRAINASALTQGYARGVNGLDGSVKLIMKENEKEYIREMQMAEFNESTSIGFANAEASLLAQAGDSAVRGSKVEALGYLGSAAKIFAETRIPGVTV